jgi:hypothetical protein
MKNEQKLSLKCFAADVDFFLFLFLAIIDSLASSYLGTISNPVVVTSLHVQMVLRHFLPIEAMIVGRNGNNSTRGVQIERGIQIAQYLRVPNPSADSRIDVVGMHLSDTSAGGHVFGKLHAILVVLEDGRIVVFIDDEHGYVNDRREVRGRTQFLRQYLRREIGKLRFTSRYNY